MYLDEGLYIFWSYLFSQNSGFAYISMQDGKTPLFIWLTTYFNPWFDNFLFTGRFISVIASTISLISWSIISAKILGRKSLFILPITFLVTPFNVLMSRLAFVDSLLIAFGSLSILGIFLLQEAVSKKQIFRSLIFALITGFSLGLAFFTKTTAKIFFYTEIFILLIWVVQFLKQKNFKSAVLLIVSSSIIAGLYFELMGYLKFGSLRHWEMIANKEAVLVFSLPELYRKFFIEHNFGIHIKNIRIYLEYLFYYFGPILVFFALGVIWVLKQRRYLWVLFMVMVLTSGVFLSAKIPASRYLAIIIPEVLLISTFGLFWIWKKNFQLLKIVSIILIIFSGFLSFKLILDPLSAYYSSDDRGNFLDYNLNALGLNESVNYLEPKRDNSAVAVTGIWGVSEGAKVAFEEKGIESYSTGRVVTVHPKQEICEEDFKELDNKCWKIDFGDIIKSGKSEKYVYFINELIDLKTLKKLTDVEVIKEFVRPETNLNVYLIKIIP